MEQNSNQWLEWRKKGIGSSDAPIIMDESEYMTRHQLWQQKLGLFEQPDEDNFIQALGHKFEKVARARMEIELGMSLPAEVAERKDMPFFRSSFDGINTKEKVFVEIKYVGKEKFDNVKQGQLPPPHFTQMQHQFFVAGNFTAYYVCYTLTKNRQDIDEFQFIPVKPDEKYILHYVERALEFWHQVQNKIEPELSASDKKMLKSGKAVGLAKAFLEKTNLIKKLEGEQKKLREQLIELATGRKSQVAELLTLTPSIRKGNVQYKNIPELKDVDLDKYRGSNSLSWTFTPIKQKEGKQ